MADPTRCQMLHVYNKKGDPMDFPFYIKFQKRVENKILNFSLRPHYYPLHLARLAILIKPIRHTLQSVDAMQRFT